VIGNEHGSAQRDDPDGARLGADCVIHSNVAVREHVLIGDRVILQNGAVIGADGFGFAPKGDGSYHKIVQSGTVILEDDVEIGANTTVDRAAVGATVIRRGAKIDNLVQVGHGCQIGEHTVVAAQAAFAGSTKIGARAMIGGQVGAAGHQSVGDGAIVAAKSGLHGDIAPGAAVAGSRKCRWRCGAR
jgi:UDP-3-O-[3-hydroxymyristoyl] glucosamine N-acyltransferase